MKYLIIILTLTLSTSAFAMFDFFNKPVVTTQYQAYKEQLDKKLLEVRNVDKNIPVKMRIPQEMVLGMELLYQNDGYVFTYDEASDTYQIQLSDVSFAELVAEYKNMKILIVKIAVGLALLGLIYFGWIKFTNFLHDDMMNSFYSPNESNLSGDNIEMQNKYYQNPINITIAKSVNSTYASSHVPKKFALLQGGK